MALSQAEALGYVASLSPQDREQLEATIFESPLSIWSPSPGPQLDAYYSKADEIFYGGAAGGGKSSLIIGLALTKHQRSLIVRRESTQLRGMKDDISRILRTRDGLNNQAGQWRIPGSVQQQTGIPEQLIEFGGVPNPGDEEAHQGIPHDLLAFDEATQLPEYVIDYLSTWNRTTTKGQRTRVVLTSNPPTPSTQYRSSSASSGLWLIRRYAPWLDPQYRDTLSLGPASPGELRYFVTLDGKEREHPDGLPFIHIPDPLDIDALTGRPREEIVTPKSRTFIPARVTDNPYLASTDYVSQLQKLPEPYRSAMLYGDFSVSLSDQPKQLFPADWVRAATARHTQLSGTPAATNAPLTALGVDVARSGADSTVIFPRRQSFFDLPVLVPASRSRTGPEVASEVLKLRHPETVVVVDANGVGASVYDHLVKVANLDGAECVGYVGSTRSTRRDASNRLGFPNKRSEAYWHLREMLDPSSPYKIAIPPDEELLQELYTHTWDEQSGKLAILTKDRVIKALGRSPDKADALVMAATVRDEEAPHLQAVYTARDKRLEDSRALRHGDGDYLGSRRRVSADVYRRKTRRRW